MKRLIVIALLLSLGAPAATAQNSAATSESIEAGVNGNPISEALRFFYGINKRYIIEGAEKMPESDYKFRPTPFARSFGQLLGHIADAQYLFCSQLRGEPNPLNRSLERELKTRTEILRAVKESFDYCDPVFESLIDAKLTDKSGASPAGQSRAAWAILNVYHGGEHYGNIATYLRLKYLVPPNTERAMERQRKAQEEKQAEAPKPPFEMDDYQMGLLKRGPRWTAEKSEEVNRIQSEHLAHLTSMAEAGKLVGAGPMLDGGELAGILIFRGVSTEEAKQLAEADPAVKSGRLIVEIHPWWGPKGIGDKYADEHKKNPSAQIPMITYQFGLLVRGEKWTAEQTSELQSLQAEHIAHIGKMAESGKLLAAGPFGDDGYIRGILIFQAASIEEAREMAERDPAVKAGRLALKLHPWMAARGVMP